MLKRFIKDYFVITFGSILAGVAIFFFMMPSNVAVGSGSALAMVLSNFIPLPVSVISLLLNVFLLILGFILVGPEFGAKTIYCAILVPVSIGIFENIFPNYKSLTDDQLIDTICYILVVGIAMAILFSRNASSGGLDIVAKIMNKHLKMEFGKASAVAGIVIALSSIVCYDVKSVIIGVLGTYFGGILVDYFIFGMNIKRRVCVISPKLDEIVDFILNELHSGATLNEIIGAYDKTTRQEVITIVDKQEFRRLMEYVKKTDPKAFVTVYSVNEIRYQPKTNK